MCDIPSILYKCLRCGDEMTRRSGFKFVECAKCGGLLEEIQVNNNKTVFILVRICPYFPYYNKQPEYVVIKISRDRAELEKIGESMHAQWIQVKEKYQKDISILKNEIEKLLKIHKADIYLQWKNPISTIASTLAHNWGYYRENDAILADMNEGFGPEVDKSVYYHLEPVYMPTFSNTACDEYYLEISEVECDL